MIGDRIIEINEFKLSYDGLFLLEFEYANEKYSLKPYLSPENFLKIILNEGLYESTQSLDFYSEGVKITKTTLLFEVFDTDNNKISFLTSEEAEHYQDSGFYLMECKIKTDKQFYSNRFRDCPRQLPDAYEISFRKSEGENHQEEYNENIIKVFDELGFEWKEDYNGFFNTFDTSEKTVENLKHLNERLIEIFQ